MRSLTYPIIHNNKLGDFDSKSWLTNGLEPVREDLLNYYKAYQEALCSLPQKQAITCLIDNRISDVPNNCFSYAIGMVVQGDLPIAPFVLEDLQLSNPAAQQLTTSYDSYTQQMESCSTGDNLQKSLDTSGFPKLSTINQADLLNYNPVIMLIKPENRFNYSDFHFIKINIRLSENGPKILIQQKEAWHDNSIMISLMEEEYLAYPMLYKNPVAYGSPKNIINREITTFKNEKENRVNLILHSNKQYKTNALVFNF